MLCAVIHVFRNQGIPISMVNAEDVDGRSGIINVKNHAMGVENQLAKFDPKVKLLRDSFELPRHQSQTL